MCRPLLRVRRELLCLVMLRAGRCLFLVSGEVRRGVGSAFQEEILLIRVFPS